MIKKEEICNGIFEMINHDNNYVGEKYGVTTEEGIKATKLLANKEGIILDPVYNQKALQLFDYVEKGIIKKGENVIFMFTVYNDDSYQLI